MASQVPPRNAIDLVCLQVRALILAQPQRCPKGMPVVNEIRHRRFDGDLRHGLDGEDAPAGEFGTAHSAGNPAFWRALSKASTILSARSCQALSLPRMPYFAAS